MPDYKTAKIYTIRCRVDNNLIYVGSTTQQLSKRMVEHRSKHNKEPSENFTKPLYVKMRELGIEIFYIELYEDFPCERKEQLEKREGEVIREIGTLNRVIAGVQYRQNKKEYHKEYYSANHDELRQKQNAYGREKLTCECGCVSTNNGIFTHKKSKKHSKLMESLNNQNSIEISS